MGNDITFNDLVGWIIRRIDRSEADLVFHMLDLSLTPRTFRMYHHQDCCESVYIESIVGDLDDLIMSPLTLSEEATNRDGGSGGESTTWTFYKLATIKGYVDIRWVGSSNGYYSESVSFVEV